MEAPPFRVLSPAGRLLYEPLAQPAQAPPSSRAPEPYKLVQPATGNYGRSHRHSSFAIIAEPRPPSPANEPTILTSAALGSSRPGSGRVSPFRGRGFKGPPPGARSRSESRRGSTSNQASPKRSQIPRLAAGKSGVATIKQNGTLGNRPSPKFGRRASNGYNSSLANRIGNAGRRTGPGAHKRQPELSPIQGSPAKRTADPSNKAARSNGQIPKPAARGARNLLGPPKANPAGKRFVTATSREAKTSKGQDSPSRIPRRQGSQLGNNHSDSSLSLSKLDNPAGKATAVTSSGRGPGAQGTSPRNNLAPGDKARKKKNKEKTSSSSRESVHAEEEEEEEEKEEPKQPGLVELLKQSSGATGTSSMVNTTTTTAVQPLQIDAASILAEKELVAKLASLERQQKQAEEQEQESSQAEEDAGTAGSRTAGKHNAAGAGPAESAGSLGQARAEKQAAAAPATPQDDTAKGERHGSSSNSQSGKASNHRKTESKASAASASAAAPADSKRPSPRPERANGPPADSQTPKPKKKPNAQEAALLGPAQTTESESLGSLHSTDTGVSVNTVKGFSSAKEKTGLHVVKRTDDIETLSGNIVHLENNGHQASAAGGPSKAPRPGKPAGSKKRPGAATRWKRLKWLRFGQKRKKKPAQEQQQQQQGEPGAKQGAASCWPKMRCLACRREPKGKPWPGKPARRGQTASTLQLTLDAPEAGSKEGAGAQRQAAPTMTASRWARIKEACRCASLRARARCRGGARLPRRGGAGQAGQVAPAGMPAARGCCPGAADRRLGSLCRGLFSRCSGPSNWCSPLSCCASACCSLPGSCCGCCCCCCRRAERPSNLRAKQSVGSVAPPPVSEENRPKLPDVLIEHNSVMHGAIPCLPVPLAWFCLICNVLAPGVGTTLSGLFNMCCGQPRFSATASPKARFGAFVVNIVVGVSQLFTVLFCLVGWGWSIWWGVTMLRVARKYKRFKESEAAANDPEARAAAAAAENITLPAPGASQALRGGGTPAASQ